MEIRLDDSYFVFFLSKTVISDSLSRSICVNGNTLKSYKSAEINLYVFSNSRHFEPLLNSIPAVMKENRDAKAFAGAKVQIGQTKIEQNPDRVNFLVFDYKGLYLPRNLELLDSNFAKSEVYLLLGEKLALIHPTELTEEVEKAWLKLTTNFETKPNLGKRYFSFQRNSIFENLARQQYYQVANSEGHHKTKYYLIKGRISEDRNWCRYNMGYCDQLTLKVSSSSDNSYNTKILAESIEKVLVDLRHISERLGQLAFEHKESSLPSFDRLTELLDIEWQLQESDTILENLSHIESSAFAREERKNVITTICDMPIFEKCVHQVQNDILSSMGVESNPMLTLCEYECGSPYLSPLQIEECNLFFIHFPLRYLHRIGLFPLLANGVIDFVMTYHKNQSQKFLILKAYAMDGVEALTKKYNLDVDRINDVKMDLAVSYYKIFLDLVATLIMGPAYLYALYRRGIFQRSPFEKAKVTTSDFFVAARLLGIELMLRRMGIKIRIEQATRIPEFKSVTSSEMAEHFFQVFNMPEVVDKVLSLDFPKKYSVKRHIEATGEIKDKLLKGLVVEADSILILNALWDSVFDTKGYANELAIFFSIFNGQRN